MKHMKKLAAMLVSVLMGFAMMTTVFADDAPTYTLTLTGTTEGHTYEAYQVFTGDLKDSTLSNVKWGSDVDSTKTADLLAALKADKTLKATFADVKDAATVAEALSKANDDDAVAQEFATVVSQYLTKTPKASVDSTAGSTSTEITGLSAGYYLVKDKDNSLSTDAYTRFILKVVGDTEAKIKSDVPTVVKKVKDTNDSTGKISGWQDSADYDIGDEVPYQITGTMPSNIGDYKTYSYAFTDTMSKGLTYTAKNAKIKIGDTDVTGSFTERVTPNADGSTTVTWTCGDLKGIKGVTLDASTKVVVNYSAKLNKDAVIGAAGNPNTVNLTYSNNPNKGGESETGKTPDDKNIVFTYKFVVNKVDQDKKSLAGAAFKLEKKKNDATYTTVKEFTAGTETSFEFKGLDDGEYKLTETTTPAGYNTIAPIKFTISAEHDVDSADPKLTSLSGSATTGEATFTAEKDAGSLTTNVVNKKGSVLPSTGGIGTTIFYVAGGLMVVVAGVLLAAKKKAEAK